MDTGNEVGNVHA